VSKWRELYQEIRTGIASGQIPAGTKLPSTRDLADERKLSRSTVITAVDQLTAEGFLESRPGSGTYVALGAGGPGKLSFSSPRRFASGGTTAPGARQEGGLIDFRSGQPDLSCFPWSRWEKAERQARLKYGSDLLRYAKPEGLPGLRAAIASYLGRVRGLSVDPERLLVCNGTTQAISLLADIFASVGVHTVWLEDPVTADIVEIFRGRGLGIHRAPVDDQGLMTTELEPGGAGGWAGHVCFVTPSHQFPTGAVLSLNRRVQLIENFQTEGAWLIEDDYDSEFRFDGPPLATLASLDPSRVVYIGTFSKTLAPGLRTAYIHLPESLVERGRQGKWRNDLHNVPLIQAALAEFLDRGYYDLHVRTMRKLYQRKRDLIRETFRDHIPGAVFTGDSAGLHGRVILGHGMVDQPFLDRCQKVGVRVYPVAAHAAEPSRGRQDFILGYGHLSFEEIIEGLGRLRRALEG